MSGKVTLTYTLELDEAKLDSYVRNLYDPPDDPVPGEPRPGLHMVHDWAEEARLNTKDGYAPDTAFWDGPYIDKLTVEVREEK